MSQGANHDSTQPDPNSIHPSTTASESPQGGLLRGRPIEVAAAGSGTVNDPSGGDTRPPGAPPPA